MILSFRQVLEEPKKAIETMLAFEILLAIRFYFISVKPKRKRSSDVKKSAAI